MKKARKYLVLLICLLLYCSVFVGCAKDEAVTKIKVNEVTHSIFYAPQYAAISNGYFLDEGLEIELTNGGGADKVMAAVLSGDSDIGLCGPESTVYVYNQNQEDYVINFAQLTKRDGAFLVGREKDDNFSIDKLRGKYIIGGRKGGMPEMTLEWVLKQNGLEPQKDVTVDTSIAFNAMSGAFVGGTGDYVALFEPLATSLEREGKGHIVMSIGEESGDVPYTVYNAKKSYIEENPEIIEKFERAVQKGLDFVANASAEEIANSIISFFPDTEMSDLISAVQRYKDSGAYALTTNFTEQSFIRLQEIVEEAGELTKPAPYDKLVYKK